MNNPKTPAFLGIDLGTTKIIIYRAGKGTEELSIRR